MTRKKAPEARVIASLKARLRDLDKVERDIGRLEDCLGLPRSRCDEPWDERLGRIHKATAAARSN